MPRRLKPSAHPSALKRGRAGENLLPPIPDPSPVAPVLAEGVVLSREEGCGGDAPGPPCSLRLVSPNTELRKVVLTLVRGRENGEPAEGLQPSRCGID